MQFGPPTSPRLSSSPQQTAFVVDEVVCSIAVMAVGAAAIHSHCYHWSQLQACFWLVLPYAMWDEKLVLVQVGASSLVVPHLRHKCFDLVYHRLSVSRW